MASTGPWSFEDFADDSAVGTETWSTPVKAESSDDNRTTVSLTETQSHYLKCTSIAGDGNPPDGATIDGIEISIERSTDGGGGVVVDAVVRLVKAGTVVGDNKASGLAWPTTDGTATYGGAADLWGTTWTAAEVKATNFGVVLSAQENLGLTTVARVDAILVTIYYTVVVGGSAIRSQCRRVSNLRRM